MTNSDYYYYYDTPLDYGFDDWKDRASACVDSKIISDAIDDFFTKDLDKPMERIWDAAMLFFTMSVMAVLLIILYNNPEIIDAINNNGEKLERIVEYFFTEDVPHYFNIALEYSKDTYNTISTEVAAIYSKYIH